MQEFSLEALITAWFVVKNWEWFPPSFWRFAGGARDHVTAQSSLSPQALLCAAQGLCRKDRERLYGDCCEVSALGAVWDAWQVAVRGCVCCCWKCCLASCVTLLVKLVLGARLPCSPDLGSAGFRGMAGRPYLLEDAKRLKTSEACCVNE